MLKLFVWRRDMQTPAYGPDDLPWHAEIAPPEAVAPGAPVWSALPSSVVARKTFPTQAEAVEGGLKLLAEEYDEGFGYHV